jgi:hypothetical protein
MIIHLAFFKAAHGGAFSKAISWKTKSPYSHVEMIFPHKIKDEKNNRELSLCFSSYEKEGGVRFKFIHLNPEKWDLVPIEIPDYEYENLLAYAASLCDAGYDWAGIFKFVLPFVRQRPHKFFCSEVCIYVLQHVCNMLWELTSYKTDPGELFTHLTKELKKEVVSAV